jgi:hypothetical protein
MYTLAVTHELCAHANVRLCRNVLQKFLTPCDSGMWKGLDIVP